MYLYIPIISVATARRANTSLRYFGTLSENTWLPLYYRGDCVCYPVSNLNFQTEFSKPLNILNTDTTGSSGRPGVKWMAAFFILHLQCRLPRGKLLICLVLFESESDMEENIKSCQINNAKSCMFTICCQLVAL